MSELERDRARRLRAELKRKDSPARRKRCRPNKWLAYRQRVAAGRRVAAVEIDCVNVEWMLSALGYLSDEGFTSRECDHALSAFVEMLAAATGCDARFENLLRTAIEIYNSGDIDP